MVSSDEGPRPSVPDQAGLPSGLHDEPILESEAELRKYAESGQVVGDQTQDPDANLPPELRPVDGVYPKLTEELMRKLRGRYFTVKHDVLTCGHKADRINQPKTNCEICWWHFFNTHGDLVNVTHEFYKERGEAALIGMRGEKYTKMYKRFMSTVAHTLREQKAQENGNQDSSVGHPSGTISEAGESGTVEAVDARGEDQGDQISNALDE